MTRYMIWGLGVATGVVIALSLVWRKEPTAFRDTDNGFTEAGW